MSNNPPEKDSRYNELRHLILGPELRKLGQLTERLENSEKFSSEISEVLPQAMVKSSEHGEELSEAMIPTVEEIVRLSIKRDINKFASALFPVIGPAIRKSIAETIRQMLQSLNQVLEHGLSWQGIKWRIQSLRTGIPFAQIVLLNSLEFRVEQVFLIHRETGILLNHVELEDALHQNADMVSSMLRAIGDFVGDSFDIDNRQELDSIQVGDFSILIEQGPGAILATASRGNAPTSLRSTMQQILEDIQTQFDSELIYFKGDTDPFEPCRGQLLLCLVQSQQKAMPKKLSLKSKLIWFVVFILIVYWFILKIYLSIQQQDYVSLLEKEPGFVITQVLYEGDQLIIKGLRDPLAREPEKFVALTTLNPKDVMLQFDPYQSFDQQLVEKRLQKIINPPVNVSMNLQAGLLTVQGYASEEKINAIGMMAPLIPGVNQVDSSGLSSSVNLSSLQPPESVELSLDINKGHLISTGSAHLSWREFARKQSRNIAGVRSYDDSQVAIIFDLSIFNPPESVSMMIEDKTLKIIGKADNTWIDSVKTAVKDHQEINNIDLSQLLNIDQKQLELDIESLQNVVIYFDSASSFDFSYDETFDRINTIAWRIIEIANKLSRPIQIVIRGYSDSVGLHQDNVLLSLERAEYVAQFLFNTGISPKYILIKGLETSMERETSVEEQRFNRRVTFEVKPMANEN